MFEDAHKLLSPDELSDEEIRRLLTAVGFDDWSGAHRRLQDACPDDRCREALGECLPMLLTALSDTATPHGSLVNFERFVQSVSDRAELFQYLSSNPRAVEILIKLFVGSQFLTEILLRNPQYLQKLTLHKRLAEFKSRQQFFEEAQETAEEFSQIGEKLDALRRYQRWELLRIGACDSFGLMDLKSVTVQLSLLADSLVQSCLTLLARELNCSPEGFAVLAFGKLGGEELNYSSDIDLVFLSRTDAPRFWQLGQRLIKALMESTAEGFLYRVDMRLRPWGSSGALVNTVDAHLKYLQSHGMQWEKQALVKARVIAGEPEVGHEFLKRVQPLIYGGSASEVRASISEMKERIEAGLRRQGRQWGEVKSGTGSIRDIEFVTQYLQLIHGAEIPAVRSINTVDGLIRLADLGLLQADEFRHLTGGYVFLRTIEHSLQLMHHKQTHSMPEESRELAYLARRLDFPDSQQFLGHYERHRKAIRNIYDKYIGGDGTGNSATEAPQQLADPIDEHLAKMEPSYSQTFTQEEIERHVALLGRLSDDRIVQVEAQPAEGGLWKLTIVGYDQVGDLSVICGLLFVYGFDIVDGHLFTDEHVTGAQLPGSSRRPSKKGAGGTGRTTLERRFLNVFTVKPPLEVVLPEVWTRYQDDLEKLLRLLLEGKQREAQGQLAKRVAGALRTAPETADALYPVEIEIDNEASERATVLHIRAEDTIGFLYELSNALACAGIDIAHMIVSSVGSRVFDTLYVTDASGAKLTDPKRQRELRAAVVLIKHFTHLLPRSPNPETALLHFQDFLEQLFQRPQWLQELSSLERTDVLEALARLLGVSDFLWEDFLRLQYDNLFPVVKDMEALAIRPTKQSLREELRAELESADDLPARQSRLNAFKDRAMFRTDMRHIVGHIQEFGQFSDELTDVADVVVEAAYEICRDELNRRFGEPLLDSGDVCPLSVCALGKCGGRELGFASDIELMFIYERNGRTAGPEVITTAEYFQKLVELFTRSITARREGIFQIDLRLRPYGRAGSLAVTLDAFRSYFGPNGAAWPYERQALVKLRTVAGNFSFGERIVALRDEMIYTGEPFDVAAMRAMREKQVRQLVKAGTVNAKLSPGGLVDCEYLVQGLQISHGHRDPTLRATNTLEAMQALRNHEILSEHENERLREAYIFLRCLIDALRMVRGHARDLTVPDPASEEFEYLCRRLGYGNELSRLSHDLERHSIAVQELGQLLESESDRNGFPVS